MQERPELVTERSTLFLLDTMALAYRAYFAFINRPRINSRGENTSAVYGFTTTLIKLIRDHGLRHAAIVLDAAGPTFRNELYSEYKANREPPPADLIANLPLIRQVAKALGIPVFEVPGVEADDVIGTLAQQAAAQDGDAIIVSPDKDFRQLLSEQITMYKPSRGGEAFDHVTLASFKEDFGVEPAAYIDVLALMGDSSDNVPGIRGVGEKTAIKLVKDYGPVEELLRQASEVKGKRAREGLEGSPDLVRLCKELVTIRTDVDVELDWSIAERRELGDLKVRKVFRRLEFNTLLDRIEESMQEGKTQSQAETTRYDPAVQDYSLVQDRSELMALTERLSARKVIALHGVFTDVRPVWSEWPGLAVSWSTDCACYIPLPLPDGTPEDEVLRILAPIFTNGSTTKVGHDIKPLIVRLALANIRLRGNVLDTAVAHYLIAPETNHSLRFVALEALNYEPVEMAEQLGKKVSPVDAEASEVMVPACDAAAVALRLRRPLTKELQRLHLERVSDDMEFPLIEVLAEMEAAGVIVDQRQLELLGDKLQTEIDDLADKIYEEAGRIFLIGSPQQVGEVLFGDLGLPVRQKTRSGKPSTREDVLAQLATEHELPGMILDWRRATRLQSTYVEGLTKMIHDQTGRVHTVFNQTVAATGRLSSSHPGLQNIPVRRSAGREMRRAFVAPEGWKLLSADYAQIELRILAHMSSDAGLQDIFATGRDLHTETAARIFGIEAGEVTRELRARAKAVNYGIPYGLSATGLAQQLRCTRPEATKLMRTHESSFPGVAAFLHEQVELARSRGYAETLWGRRRYLPDLNSRNRAVRSAAERIAVNMPIQGTQADMIKVAMVVIQEELQRGGYRTRLILQVHDELLLEVPYYELDDARSLVTKAMKEALPLNVRVEVDAGYGATWLDAH